jgi:hypothetical protein
MMQLAGLRRFCHVFHVSDLPENLVPVVLWRLDGRTARIEDRLLLGWRGWHWTANSMGLRTTADTLPETGW